MDVILLQILDIKKDNGFLSYIVKRVQREDYRGIQVSQHNRFELKKMKATLKSIYDVVGENFLPVPIGDIDPEDLKNKTSEEWDRVIKKIIKELGKITHNSLKKNLLPDFARAGVIVRFDKEKRLLDPHKRSIVSYAKLTENGIEFAKSESAVYDYYCYRRSINTLLEDIPLELAETLFYSGYKDTSISCTEFQYIFSDNKLSSDEKIDLLIKYRDLEDIDKRKVDELLKKYCKPERFGGDKTKKRDYDNWRNETQQIMSLISDNTIYFDVGETNYSLKLNKNIR